MQLNIWSKQIIIEASSEKQNTKCVSKWDSGMKEAAPLEPIVNFHFTFGSLVKELIKILKLINLVLPLSHILETADCNEL